jgi:hypothetical protein
VAYLKFSRDKRGYEHFYLVEPANRGKARTRLLYWFRTPPGVKVGRTPFDADMRRALEAQNPDVNFDWPAIARTPIPPPAEMEKWRERRRAEKAMRLADAEEANAPADPPESLQPPSRAEAIAAAPLEPPFAAEPDSSGLEDVDDSNHVDGIETTGGADSEHMDAGAATGPRPASNDLSTGISASTSAVAENAPRRRRRRRRPRKPQGQGEV